MEENKDVCCKDKKCCCKCTSLALIVSGILFGLLALVHLYRVFYFFPVVIGTVAISSNVSIVVVIIAALLSIWMFVGACKCCKKCRCVCHKDSHTQ
jgi:uncharacterized protein YqhQ